MALNNIGKQYGTLGGGRGGGKSGDVGAGLVTPGGKGKVIRMNLDDVLGGDDNTNSGASIGGEGGIASISDSELDGILSKLGQRSKSRNGQRRKKNHTSSPLSPVNTKNVGNGGNTEHAKHDKSITSKNTARSQSIVNVPNEIVISSSDMDELKKKKRSKSAPTIPDEVQNKMDAFDKLDSIFIANSNSKPPPPLPQSIYPTYMPYQQQSTQPSQPPSYNSAINMPRYSPQIFSQQPSNVAGTNTSPMFPESGMSTTTVTTSRSIDSAKVAELEERIKKVREQIHKINAKIKKQGRSNVKKKYLDALASYERKEKKYGKMLEEATSTTSLQHNIQFPHNTSSPYTHSSSRHPPQKSTRANHISSPTMGMVVQGGGRHSNSKLDMMGDLDDEIAAANIRLNQDLKQPSRPGSRIITPSKSILKQPTGSTPLPQLDKQSGRLSAADLDKKKEQQASIYSMSTAINGLKKRKKFMLEKQQKLQREYEHKKRQIDKIKSRQEEVRRLKELEKEHRRIYDMERKMKKLERYQYLQTQKLKEELYAVNYAEQQGKTKVETTAKRHHNIDQKRKIAELEAIEETKRQRANQQSRQHTYSVAPFLPLGSPPSRNPDGTIRYPEGYISWFLKRLGRVKIGEQVVFDPTNSKGNCTSNSTSIPNGNGNGNGNGNSNGNENGNENGNDNGNGNSSSDDSTATSLYSDKDIKTDNTKTIKNKTEVTRYRYHTTIPSCLKTNSNNISDCDDSDNSDSGSNTSHNDKNTMLGDVEWTCHLDTSFSDSDILKVATSINKTNESANKPMSLRVDLSDYLDISNLDKVDSVVTNKNHLQMLCMLCQDCHVVGGRINHREIATNGVDEAFSLSSTPLPIDPSS